MGRRFLLGLAHHELYHAGNGLGATAYILVECGQTWTGEVCCCQIIETDHGELTWYGDTKPCSFLHDDQS